MTTLLAPSAADRSCATERALLALVERPDVSLDEVVALGVDLRGELQALDHEGRQATLVRLRRHAETLRAQGQAPDAVLIEIVLRSLQRFLR